MYTEIMACSMPVFKDRTVFILMILLSVFQREGDLEVECTRNVFLSILRRYLEEHNKTDVDFEMQNIFKCINALTKIHNIFTQMTNFTQSKVKYNSEEGTAHCSYGLQEPKNAGNSQNSHLE